MLCITTATKVSKFRFFSGPHFLVSGLYTDIYIINLRIQSAYGKMLTTKNPESELFHAVHSATLRNSLINLMNCTFSII